MILDDLLDSGDGQQQQDAPTPQENLRQLFEKSKEIDSRLSALKSAPAPTLAEAPKDDLEPLSNDLLRGFFKAGMPPQENDVPNFGDQFRKSISPAREVLANMMNGVSSTLLGTKFKSVREEAFARYTEEQKLGMEKQNLQRQAMQGAAQLAQKTIETHAEDTLRRDMQAVKSAEKGTDQEIALMKFKQSAEQFQQKYGLDVANLVQKIAHETNTEQKSPDKFYEDARQQALGLYKKQGLNPDDAANKEGFQKLVSDRAHQLRLRDLQDQAANRPDPTPKTATPQIVYTPTGDGGFKVSQASPGSTLPPGSVTGAGMNAENVPTSATRAMAEKAPVVVDFTNKIDSLVNNVEKQIGPMTGRGKDFAAGKLGVKVDTDIVKLRSELSLLTTRLMNMHVGQKGGDKMMDHFSEMIGGLKQDPSNTHAVMEVIRDYANTVMQEGSVGAMSKLRNDAKKPSATIRMTFPGGVERDVPASDADYAVSKYGAKRK